MGCLIGGDFLGIIMENEMEKSMGSEMETTFWASGFRVITPVTEDEMEAETSQVWVMGPSRHDSVYNMPFNPSNKPASQNIPERLRVLGFRV